MFGITWTENSEKNSVIIFLCITECSMFYYNIPQILYKTFIWMCNTDIYVDAVIQNCLQSRNWPALKFELEIMHVFDHHL
jgi:hypothetical protein